MNPDDTSPTRVLTLGESLMDVIESVGEHGSPDRTTEHPGGSPMNIAFGLGRLGRRVTLVTDIGSDARGRLLRTHLESAGVVLAPGSIRAGRTSTATARLRADGSADYVFDLHWTLPAGFVSTDSSFDTAQIVHAGSIGAFLEPGGSGVAALLSELAARPDPPLITFDPNIRPSILPDHAAVLRRFERIAASATVVKLSDEDALWLYPAADLDAATARILQLGATLVVVTCGSGGALLATRAERLLVPGMPVEVADTIGAGDSFLSALIDRLASLLDEGATTEAIRDGQALSAERLTTMGEFAVRCAAITVSRNGADPPTRADVAHASPALIE
jgi:fructokinase